MEFKKEHLGLIPEATLENLKTEFQVIIIRIIRDCTVIPEKNIGGIPKRDPRGYQKIVVLEKFQRISSRYPIEEFR